MTAFTCSLCLALLTSCATPALRYERAALNRGFDVGLIVSGNLGLRTIAAGSPSADRPLHVYLEGDGTPMTSALRTARDATPRDQQVLRLMARDPAPRVLLGRPCYHGRQTDPGCSDRFWTDQRYADVVVDAMADGVAGIAARTPHSGLVLIGYSGGGALAVLIADRLRDTRPVAAIVTLAANLDIDAWRDHNGYAPLAGSLNPAEVAPLPAAVLQLHLVGERDRQVPPGIAQSFASGQPGAEVRIVDGFDHHCCWHELWPAVLETIP